MALPVDSASVLPCFIVPKNENPPSSVVVHMSSMSRKPPTLVPNFDRIGLALRTIFSSLATQELS